MSEGTAAENQTSEATTNGTPNPDSQGQQGESTLIDEDLQGNSSSRGTAVSA